MKLAASLIVRNEVGRYLEPCIGHLLEFCDEIVVLDDSSDDGTYEWFVERADPRIQLHCEATALETRPGEPAFFKHARMRNRLAELTVAAGATHVLAIDADEFVDDGAALRAACGQPRFDAWRLCLEEVWNVSVDGLEVRQDGGWNEHDVAMLWRPDRVRRLAITDRGHATGRVPEAVHRGRIGYACVSLLHFGWANHAERDARYARYAEGDGGKFHAKRHIESIMWPPERVTLSPRPWPSALNGYRERILERAGMVTA